MRIVHYTLGIPPVRIGGLIKYVIDVAEEQAVQMHDVWVLYPGKLSKEWREPEVGTMTVKKLVKYCPIHDSQPVPLAGGILNPESFMHPCDETIFWNMWQDIHPDVLHIHSLMGIYKEMVETAKQLGIRIVYTTHDFFGVCPRTDLMRQDDSVCREMNWDKCQECCMGAYSMKKMIFQQSKWYPIYNNSSVVNELRSNSFLNALVRRKKAKNISQTDGEMSTQNIDYSSLRLYYRSIFKLVDRFLYNSSQTMRQYEKRMPFATGAVLSILHKNMNDNRRQKTFGKTLRISYMGGPKVYKGYQMLKAALDNLYYNKKKTDFVLQLYFYDKIDTDPYIEYNGNYSYEDMPAIMEKTDLVVVPSLWYETFGFVAAEAISFGVPVLITGHVGAKDMLSAQEELGKVVPPTTEGLQQQLEHIYDDRSILEHWNENICKSELDFSFTEHVCTLTKLYGNRHEWNQSISGE